MKNLTDVSRALPGLDAAMTLAADWLADAALITTRKPIGAVDRVGHKYDDWRGTFRGEYNFSDPHWWFFCPMWHGAQAVKALVRAYGVAKHESWFRAAEMGADFVLRNQLHTGDDAGLLLAYEDFPDKVTVSALLESVDGLFELHELTDEKRYATAGVQAVQWCAEHAWLRGEGLVQDLYDPQTRKFITDAYPSLKHRAGRPLVDDAVWLTAYRLGGDATLRISFYEILERLLLDESPSGNWVTYGPCNIEDGTLHPRHAYWWGRPLMAAWRDTGDRRWLESACRAGDWYRQAQRLDGGLFRETDLDFNTTSFGQATSGILCAAILWMELFEATKDPKWLEPIKRAFQFGMKMQLTSVTDPILKGAILEGTREPDGTDRCPYFIRDLASIFFVQAAAMLLQHAARETEVATGDRPAAAQLIYR